MANLPSERVLSDEPPFTKVGMDFFGPFDIKRGRTTVKRYGVIFTCMVIRAVHIEVAPSLDTDSCINAIRRFIARRGQVKSITSDNGTNLVGAEREMRQSIETWNREKIHHELAQKNISWHFNPPSASNFGGVWERLIKTFRKILYSLMKEQNILLNDDSLHTLFCEIEAIRNGRPLTEMPNSPTDLQPLTPNHLLIHKAGECLPPGIFNSNDIYARRHWRQAQYLADIFWRRWVTSYLPLLQKRQKWFHPQKNLSPGDIVLIMDNTPRNAWAMGRIGDVKKDKNDCVRVVKLKTKSSILMRPVNKLCKPLEADV